MERTPRQPKTAERESCMKRVKQERHEDRRISAARNIGVVYYLLDSRALLCALRGSSIIVPSVTICGGRQGGRKRKAVERESVSKAMERTIPGRRVKTVTLEGQEVRRAGGEARQHARDVRNGRSS
eukprot:1111301-Rhodomonas_salina.2